MFIGVPDLVDPNEDHLKQIKRSNKKKTEGMKELNFYKSQNLENQNL
eukprot:gene10926-12733_t